MRTEKLSFDPHFLYLSSDFVSQLPYFSVRNYFSASAS